MTIYPAPANTFKTASGESRKHWKQRLGTQIIDGPQGAEQWPRRLVTEITSPLYHPVLYLSSVQLSSLFRAIQCTPVGSTQGELLMSSNEVGKLRRLWQRK